MEARMKAVSMISGNLGRIALLLPVAREIFSEWKMGSELKP
jgi:hypothetical protein